MLDAHDVYHRLKDELLELDIERQSYNAKVSPFKYTFWCIFLGGGIVLFYFFNFTTIDLSPIWIIIYAGLVFVTFLVFQIVRFNNLDQFKKTFVNQIAPKVIEALGPTFSYRYQGGIPEQKIRGSMLFGEFHRYRYQDLVLGVINDIPIQFGEIKLIKRHSSGGDKKSTTIFSGIFFTAEINLEFPTDIWMIHGHNSSTLRKRNKERVKGDHQMFRKYRVYSDNTALAKKILQPSILDRLDALNRNLKRNNITRYPVSYHFGGRHVDVCINTQHKFMEPKLSRSVNSVEFIEQQTRLLNALYGLLNELTLK